MSRRTTKAVSEAVAAAPVEAPANGAAPSTRVDKGRKRSGLELPRKILHSSMSLGIVATWLAKPSVPAIQQVAGLATVVIVCADLIRFRSRRFAKFYESVLGIFMREEEKTQINGVVYYLVGILVCLTFYPRDIACLSIVILSLCDTVASVFGRLFGRYTPRLPLAGILFSPRKSLAGSLAASLMGAWVGWFFWTRLASYGDAGDLSWVPARVLAVGSDEVRFRLKNPGSTMSAAGLATLCGAVAGVAEAIDVFGMDDNLSLPVLFGFFLWASMTVLG